MNSASQSNNESVQNPTVTLPTEGQGYIHTLPCDLLGALPLLTGNVSNLEVWFVSVRGRSSVRK